MLALFCSLPSENVPSCCNCSELFATTKWTKTTTTINCEQFASRASFRPVPGFSVSVCFHFLVAVVVVLSLCTPRTNERTNKRTRTSAFIGCCFKLFAEAAAAATKVSLHSRDLCECNQSEHYSSCSGPLLQLLHATKCSLLGRSSLFAEL